MSERKTIYLDDALKAIRKLPNAGIHWLISAEAVFDALLKLPSAQPEYEPVKAEDFARTMSENTLYSFMAWHQEALTLMKRQGFVICKKTT